MFFPKVAFTILIVFVLTSFATLVLTKGFTDLLSRANMMFEATDGLAATKIIENRSCSYEYAIKYPDKNFEIRYAIRPADNAWAEYEKTKKDLKKGEVNTNPDSVFLSAFQTIILNTSNGEFPDVKEFDKAAVKSEFNADWGGTVIIHPRSEFGQNIYQYCMIVALHKSHAGDAYIFYLSDTKDGFNDLVAPAFHSLRFNSL